ncbi:hypothetical protein [Candidatus Nitrosotenuis aquarius]|uniref:hypothetical protein n=1 Tax=Candidatus Nitrosotenuis aquarius TaxID=1846278 RepID=UPI000C1F916E|nr:hypothetical protein [Candidatus Nitrosotenuis aquarius]
MEIRNVRTLIEIDRNVWSQTKAFATLHGINISAALRILLTESLEKNGFKTSDLNCKQEEKLF